MRRIFSLLVSVVLLLGIATPVAANGGGRYPSERLPIEDFWTEFAPGETCDFAVRVEAVSGTITYTDMGTTLAGVKVDRLWFREVARFTNLSTGESAEFAERSPTIIRVRPDGSARIAYHGTYWTYFFDGDASNLARGLYWVENGLGIEYYDAFGTLISAHTQGTVTDLCALLS